MFWLDFTEINCTVFVPLGLYSLSKMTSYCQISWSLEAARYGSSGTHWWPNFGLVRLRQNGHYFPDDIFKCIFLNENMWILIKILLKFVPEGPINNIPALVQIMAWRQPGDKPLSEPMMISLLTHICITRPQWIKNIFKILNSQKKIWKDKYSPQCLLIA